MAPTLSESVRGSLDWRMIGPHRGGRVVAVAGDVSDPMTFYFGACAGGVWKSADGGTFWHNVSDGYFTTAAVGALAISESDPNVIYAGTGEACIRGNVSHGDGVYKSNDAGRTWRNLGLPDTRHIGKIQIHPRDPEIAWVAAFGHAWGPSDQRGVFRTTDGGRSWERSLFKSPRAGSHDIALDPINPRIIYAAIWQAQRYPHKLESGGEECGLWRSLDGGDSWEDLTRRPGLPTGMLGKIGVTVSRARPGRVWALVEAADGAVFRSDDYGETWLRLSEQSLLRTRPWYYMHITADPVDPDTVYVQNYSMWKSIDAGATFERRPAPHGDEHALWIDPANNRRMIIGNDGGAAVSFNGGESFSTQYNQPTAQLYHVTTDERFPYRVYASQQDNTAISIPSATEYGVIHERDWYAPGGGESGYIGVKPDDEDIVVASGPIGRRAYNDIMTMYDRRTRQRWNISVWPELYGWGAGAESLKYRLQWTFPILFSRHDPNVLYIGANQLLRSTNLGASFDTISPDLTRNDPEKLKPSGGPITRDNTGAEVYCTIFALAESPQQPGLLWAGSDDGLINISEDGGRTWQNITPPDLPEWALISIIELSAHDENTAYVAATRYKHDDTRPYLYRTADGGSSWTLITAGIPDEEFTRVIRADQRQPGLLFAGTETGIYVSLDDGGNWERLGGLPVVPVHDLVVKDDELVVATHGRSIWILDDVEPLRQLARSPEGVGPRLFAPRTRVRTRAYGGPDSTIAPGMTHYAMADTSMIGYVSQPLSDGTTRMHLLNAGENPPLGAVLRYYLPEAPAGEVRLSILDADGAELRRFSSASDGLPVAAGMNRFLWNMRLPGVPGVTGPDLEPWHRPDGPLVVPGAYQVRLVAGELTLTQPLVVELDPRVATSQDDLRAQFDFLGTVLAKLALTNETLNAIDALTGQATGWRQRAEAAGATDVARLTGELCEELAAVRGKLIDVNMRQSQLWPSGLHEKFNALFESVDSADFAPPRQAHEVFAKLSSELDELRRRYAEAAGPRAAALNTAIQKAGLPAVGIPD